MSSYTDRTLSGIANLIKLLPTGTMFVFEFLNPLLSNTGDCDTAHKYLTVALIAVCAVSCFVSTFTDSYNDANGTVHYVVVTTTGVWPTPDSNSGVDASKHKLKLADFAHAFLVVIVFLVVALFNSNTVQCLYPSIEETERAVRAALPAAAGTFSSVIFALWPSTRNSIGSPSNYGGSSSSS